MPSLLSLWWFLWPSSSAHLWCPGTELKSLYELCFPALSVTLFHQICIFGSLILATTILSTQGNVSFALPPALMLLKAVLCLVSMMFSGNQSCFPQLFTPGWGFSPALTKAISCLAGQRHLHWSLAHCLDLKFHAKWLILPQFWPGYLQKLMSFLLLSMHLVGAFPLSGSPLSGSHTASHCRLLDQFTVVFGLWLGWSVLL